MLGHDVVGQFHQGLCGLRANSNVELIGGELGRSVEIDVKVNLVAAKPQVDFVSRVVLNNRAITATHPGIRSKAIQLHRTAWRSIGTDSLRNRSVRDQNSTEGCRHRRSPETKKGPATRRAFTVLKDFQALQNCRLWTRTIDVRFMRPN